MDENDENGAVSNNHNQIIEDGFMETFQEAEVDENIDF